ncbi:MAG: metal-dependent hydrolase [Candidatus Hodarchaeales archaeon]|jgi:hypothetical protein
MTIFPTHLSLASILLWIFISSSEREKFQKNKKFFWIVVLFSVLPDIDSFVGLHRGISHSILFPILLTIIGTIIYYVFQYSSKKETINDKDENLEQKMNYNFVGRCISYSGILWLLHIVLDLEYPLAIFYPLSDRLYQLNFAILIDVIPWLIFPAMIVGIGFEISGISYLQGLTTYFINIPPEIRQQIWGHEPVTIMIGDFFIHTFLFVIFLVFVARPMAPNLGSLNLSQWKQKIKFDGHILGLGVILIMMGILIGPMVGTLTIDTNSVNGSYQVDSNVFSPSIAVSFETTNYLLQPNTLFLTESYLKTPSENEDFDIVLVLTTRESHNNFSNSVSQLFKKHPLNTSENIRDFETNYSIILTNLYSSSFARNTTDQNETSIYFQLPSGSFAVLGVIESWNSNSSEILNGTRLVENARLEVTVSSDRFSLLFLGIISMILGFGVSIYSVKVLRKP